MSAVLFRGEDGVKRPEPEHRQHLLGWLKIFGTEGAKMYDEDVARRIRSRLQALDRWCLDQERRR